MSTLAPVLIEKKYADKMELHNYEVENIKQQTCTIDTSALKPNHRVFEFNSNDMMIRPAEVIKNNVLFVNRRNLIEFKVKKGCIYAPALNAQNAEKRFKKRMAIKK